MWTIEVVAAISFALSVCASPRGDSFFSGEDVPMADWTTALQGLKTAPRMAISAPLDGARRQEILYGPYTVSSTKMFTTLEPRPQRPCSQCFITSMEATLKFADGREATTAQDGAWLHHVVLSNGFSPIWAAGNERPTLRLNSEINKFGINFPDDGLFNKFSMLVELMSEAPKPLDVRLSITYEYILKSQPEAKNYKGSVLMWNDIGPAPRKRGVYSFTSTPMKAPVSGKLLYAMGHMHDGGVNTTLYIERAGRTNRSPEIETPEKEIKAEIACGSLMRYDTGPGYGGSKAQHINSPGVCYDFGHVYKGDLVKIAAWYDTNQYPLDGTTENLMGIMRLFIGPE